MSYVPILLHQSNYTNTYIFQHLGTNSSIYLGGLKPPSSTIMFSKNEILCLVLSTGFLIGWRDLSVMVGAPPQHAHAYKYILL